MAEIDRAFAHDPPREVGRSSGPRRPSGPISDVGWVSTQQSYSAWTLGLDPAYTTFGFHSG